MPRESIKPSWGEAWKIVSTRNITQEINHEVLLENDLCIYSLMQDQEIQGAGIIMPRSHKETVFDLSQEEWNATYQLLHEVSQNLFRK